MFSNLYIILLFWLLSLLAIGLAVADTSIHPHHHVSDSDNQISTGARGSFTATVGSWNNSASPLRTSNCACNPGTASGAGTLGACTLCLSTASVAPGSPKSVIGSAITNSRQYQLSTPGPHFSNSRRSNSNFGSGTGSLYHNPTAAPLSSTAAKRNLASGISGKTWQANSTGFASSSTFRRNSSSNVWRGTLGRLPTAALPSSLTQHVHNTSRPIPGTQPWLSSITPVSTSAIARNNSDLANSVVTTNAPNGSSSFKTFTASGMPTLGSIVHYNSSLPAFRTGSPKPASETLRSRPSSQGNSSTQRSIPGTGSAPSTSSIAIPSTNSTRLSDPKINASTPNTEKPDLVPPITSLTLSHNATGPPSAILTLSRTSFASSTTLSSNHSQLSFPLTLSSSLASIVVPINNTSLATQQAQTSLGSKGQNALFTTTASTSQPSAANTSPSSFNAYATVSSSLTLVTPTVETSPIVETEANGLRTTVTAPVTIGAGGVVVPPPIIPIGAPFPDVGGGGGSSPGGGSGDDPAEPQLSGSQTLNTEASNLPGSTTQSLTRPASSTLISNTQPSSMITSLTSSTLSRSSLSLSTSTLSSSTQMSTTSCSSCDVCSTFDYNPTAAPNAPGNSDDLTKRQLGGRFYNAKRAGKGNNVPATTVGGTCTVLRYTKKPAYPGPASVANDEPPGVPASSMTAFFSTATYWAVPTQPPQGACGAPGWAFLSTQQIKSYEVNGRPEPWKLGGDKGKRVNIDHVYEVSLLEEFFATQVARGTGITCDDVVTLFNVPDVGRTGTRLNTIFAQLPSYDNPDLLGMDAGLNGLKGNLWNPGLTGVSFGNNANAYQQSLADLAVVMSIASRPVVSSLFESTNARIYQAFLGIDELISQSCSPILNAAGSPLPAIWASAYKTWIISKVAAQNALITSTASSLSAAIPTLYNANKPDMGQKKVNNFGSFISNFNTEYRIDALTFPVPTVWPTTPLAFTTSGAPCPLNPPITAGPAGTTAVNIAPSSETPGQVTVTSAVQEPSIAPSITPPPAYTVSGGLLSTVEPILEPTMAVESLCFIDGVGDTANCDKTYKTLETITVGPEPTIIPGLSACLYDDSDSEDCEIFPGPNEAVSFTDIATELPFKPLDRIPDPEGIVDPEGGKLDK